MAEFLIRKTGSLRKNVDEWTADRGRFQAKRAFGRKVARADLGVRCRVELHAKSERIEKPEGRQRPGVLGRSPRRQAAATRRGEKVSSRTRSKKSGGTLHKNGPPEKRTIRTRIKWRPIRTREQVRIMWRSVQRKPGYFEGRVGR